MRPMLNVGRFNDEHVVDDVGHRFELSHQSQVTDHHRIAFDQAIGGAGLH